MKLLVCDVEGTILKAKYKTEGSEYASTMWQPIARCLGKAAIEEEKESDKKFHNGEYKNYAELVEATIKIHKKDDLHKRPAETPMKQTSQYLKTNPQQPETSNISKRKLIIMLIICVVAIFLLQCYGCSKNESYERLSGLYHMGVFADRHFYPVGPYVLHLRSDKTGNLYKMGGGEDYKLKWSFGDDPNRPSQIIVDLGKGTPESILVFSPEYHTSGDRAGVAQLLILKQVGDNELPYNEQLKFYNDFSWS